MPGSAVMFRETAMMRRGLPAASDAFRQQPRQRRPHLPARAQNQDVSLDPAHARDVRARSVAPVPFRDRPSS